MDSPASLDLDLLKRCLTNWVYGDAEVEDLDPRPLLRPEVLAACAAQGVRVVRPRPFDREARAFGRDWPPTAHTMVGLRRLDNLPFCVEDVLRRGVPRDLIETGAWRGGATILMRGVLKAHGVTDRLVWVADSFAGLPLPDPARYPHDKGLDLYRHGYLAVPQEQVRATFERYRLLDEEVKFLKGWFRGTLPNLPAERLAMLRLDGDLYESTADALTHLYPKLSPGGYMIIDDYGNVAACRQAVHDDRDSHGITDPIMPFDGSGVFWRKSG